MSEKLPKIKPGWDEPEWKYAQDICASGDAEQMQQALGVALDELERIYFQVLARVRQHNPAYRPELQEYLNGVEHMDDFDATAAAWSDGWNAAISHVENTMQYGAPEDRR